MHSPRSIEPILRVAAFALAFGCGGGASDDDGGATETEGHEPRPMPDFVEPASDEILVGVKTHEDLSLPVASVVPGITSLVVDGVDVGMLLGPGDPGHLTADRLELRLEGAMVPGVHEMLLRTPDTDETLHSRVIRVILAQEPAPQLLLELDAEPGPVATALTASAFGEDSLLAVVDHAALPDPIVRVLPLVDTKWSTRGARTFAAPGLRRAPDERAPALSACLVGDANERLRAAWRVGFPGERIDLIEVAWQDDLPGTPVAALTLATDLTGPVEWAAFGRPLVIGDRLIAELARHTDVEAQAPGELALATAVLDGGGPGLPQLLQLGVTADLDALAPAVDLLALSGGTIGAVSLRLARRRPILVELGLADASVRVRPSVAMDDPPGFDELSSSIITIAGAFGSRTIAAFDAERLRVLRYDDSGVGGLVDVSPPTDQLPAPSGVTAEIAGTVVDGAPVFVLPFGSAAPLFAAIVTETSTTVQVLSEIGCEAVATAATPAGNDAGTAAIACLRDGTVRGGRLRLAP